MDNKEIAAHLQQLAVYKELAGENVFKVRALEQAARTIENYTQSMASLKEQNSLTQVKGVGAAIAEIITDLLSSGTSRELTKLKQSVPAGLDEMLTLEGVGPKKARAVWQKLGITTIGELEYACRENRLRDLEGFGDKSQEKILKAIARHNLYRGRFLYADALEIAKKLRDELTAGGLFGQVTIAGSLRRGKNIVKDADILVVPAPGTGAEEISQALTGLADKSGGGDEQDIISAGDTKISIRNSGLQVDFRIIPEESYACALQHFTGSKEHNTQLRGRAKTMGYKMNEYGIFEGDTPRHPATEEEVYGFLGLPWIAPELREAHGEVEAAEQGKLPVLVECSRLKGMLHVHTNHSDGVLSVEEMARECIKRGFSYLCLSDHSKSAFYAHGLSPERLLAQINEIREVNQKLTPFRIFAGVESDILADGSLDYDPDILEKLDFVIGAVHSKLTMGREEATARLLAAVRNPYLTILAHPSGRLLLSRQGYEYDDDTLFDAMAEHGVVLEHNCNPHRLDPDWQTLQKAARRGILISLDPDAHDAAGLDHVYFGCVMARKAWLGAADILNCKTQEEINEFFTHRKKKARP
jgi:DNA polymerase (family 10)